MELAQFFDHTLLKPEANQAQIEKLCQEALRYGFFAVCINPSYVPLAVSILKGTKVKVCSVVGFPLGATLPEVKAFEAEKIIAMGAEEIDMVMNIGAMKSGNYALVREDIASVVAVARRAGALVKVILETALLDPDEKIMACKLAVEAGADFVKTSTGFGPGGATVEDVRLMRETVGEKIGVKAAGGISTLEQALAMIEAGANRIGASRSVKIIQEAEEAWKIHEQSL
ncbi:MAG: deoxyribose-phosphate aldolase [Anaerolineae bacterium]|nr:deoxyribose-phosphate aldolase [Anaerolineae bacterium]MDW8102417.1 deoxyribose-phosphate aldolase [Anaerolineae bacterium]